ncbi:hypothetical protein [Oceanobacillus zhaokaii]|uniref:hypothetical protein n=1 Tax=Oceanobacillus zhaokaii TaxID=2052660 RepID=UPI001966ACC6|nr:hypothetical protein [Oceanobacillus zhaokaii]
MEERITLMNRFRGNEELKAKIFSVNILNDLLNIAFSNSLKLIIEFYSLMSNKDQYQKDLSAQINYLASPKRGYNKYTDLADSNVRNAISHGGIKINGSTIHFTFRKGQNYLNHQLTVYEFKDSLLQLFDGVSANLLSWFGYLCEENITYNEIYENQNILEDTSLFFEKLSLSTLLTDCDRVWETKINNQDTKKVQINVEFSGVDLDINSRIFIGLHTAERIFQLRKLPLKDSIMISFHSPKVVNSFFTVDCSVIDDLSKGRINAEEASKIIWNSGNILMFPINEENRNEFEDFFRYYPDFENEDFYITEIEDISNENQKRLKAVVYLKRAKRKRHVQEAVESILDRLKLLENYGFSSHKVKHGKMQADIIYLILYKKEVRRGKERALLPSNSNFIAQIQYDVDMKFPIQNNFINGYLKKRREKTIEYNWNPNF